MFILAATLFLVTPGEPSAFAHERTSKPLELAASDLPKSIWRSADNGDAVHLQSTLACPPSIGAFRRNDLVPYDGFGFDVGCGYAASGSAKLTLYLTHRGGATLQENFDSARSALTTVLPDAKPIDGAAPTPAGNTKFLAATYKLGDVETGLWVADIAGWTLKFRVTYQPRLRTDVLDALTKATEQAQRTAGVHLTACAAAPPVERNGAPITDPELLMRLSLIGGMSEQAGSENVTPPQSNDRWCAEDAVRDRQAPMLYWRNVANDGADGPLDRLSLMTMGEPPIWLLSANAIANLLVDEKDKPGPLIHQLTAARGGKIYLFAYYRGRPGLAMLGPFVRDIFTGKTGAIASYDSQTNTITIAPQTGKPES